MPRDFTIETLLHGGIITERTKHLYEAWVHLGELSREPEGVVGARSPRRHSRSCARQSGRKKIGRAFKEMAQAG